MDQRDKELQEILDKLVATLRDQFPPGLPKEMAACKLHEMVWWMQKSHADAELAKKDPVRNKDAATSN